MKKKSSVQEFADTIKDDPDKIIAWAKDEIKEYQKLIKILEKANLIPESYRSTKMVEQEYLVPRHSCHLATKLEKAEYAILRLGEKGGLVK